MSIQDWTGQDRTSCLRCHIQITLAPSVGFQPRYPYRTGQDKTGQDILPEMPYIDCIGHRRLHFGYCIQPPMQDHSPNVHSVMSMGEVGQYGTGQDRTGQDRTGRLC